MFSKAFKLSGLTCPACKKLVEKRIMALSGVKQVEVDYNTGVTIISAAKNIKLADINEVLNTTPYHPKN